MSKNVFSSSMVSCYVTDKDDNSMRLSRIENTDYVLPYFSNALHCLRFFPNIEAYEDDTLVCGYPKCGTNWVWEISCMLKESSSSYVKNIKVSAMLEAIPTLDYVRNMHRPRVFNTHFPPRLLPKDFLTKKSKIIYLLRKPKAVAVSYYHQVYSQYGIFNYQGRWDAFLGMFLEGNVPYGHYYTYMKEWEPYLNKLPVHIVQYEHLKLNPVNEISRLAEFLEVDVSENVVQEIANNTDFAKMKKEKVVFNDEGERSNWLNKEPMMLRKGEIDDWKNLFTVAQSEHFDNVFNKGKSKWCNIDSTDTLLTPPDAL